MEWISDNPVGKSSTKRQKGHTHFRKMKEKINFDEYILPNKTSYGHVNCRFVVPNGRIVPESRTYYPTIVKKSNFIPILILPERVPMDF